MKTPTEIDTSPATTPVRAGPSRGTKTTEEEEQPVLPRDESGEVAVPAAPSQTFRPAPLREIYANLSDPDEIPASSLTEVDPTPFPDVPSDLALATSEDHDEAARRVNEDREEGRKRGKQAEPKFQECYGLVRDAISRVKSLDQEEVSCIIFLHFGHEILMFLIVTNEAP